MKTGWFFSLMMIITSALCLAIVQPVSAASDEEEVLQVVADWAKAYNANDLKLMSSLYSPAISIFTPPNSGAFLREGWGAVEADLKSQFSFPEGTSSVSCHNIQPKMLGDNHAVITDYMVFTFNPPMVEEQASHQARRSLVVQKIGGKWLIVHEHASMLPVE